ncbi:MAG: NAD(P)H-dependent oxidoreductase subunit E [Ruminococcaceae bacterium]|nr:NAD(P)H-dependent oxidoreductase subunit E [Oscillospiraceae bacterium]
MGNNCECCNDEKLAKLQAIIEENKDKQGALIHVLHDAQLIYGYLPIEVQKVIAEGMNIPLAEVYGVVTFYAQFSLKPKGEYKISICLGTACYVKGADLVLDKFKEQLNIEVGDCTEDGKFSLDACRCIGACGLAPVLTVNNDVYGRLVPEDVPGILAKY